MALNTQTFSSLVQNMAAAVQSSASALIDLTVGSVIRAILEANASVALWLQWLILQVLAMTRLATSAGDQVDSWIADFMMTRLQGSAATGTVTFSRYQTTIATYIPVGALAKTSDGTRVFQVVADSTNSAWNGSTGFTLASGAASVSVTVQDVTTGTSGALSIGAAGNVSAGAISLIASAIAGVDTVTNAAPFTNGIDAETDPAVRARFQNYIQTRSRGTVPAVGYAISAVRQGLQYTIQENVNTIGTYAPGSFVVTVDDGSGAPSSGLLTSVSAAIAAYRPIGSVWAVQAPSVVTATISMTIASVNKAALLASVKAAVLAYVDSLPDGAMLPYTRLAMVAYMVDPSITDVTAVLLNGGAADLVPGPGGVVKATSGSVSIT